MGEKSSMLFEYKDYGYNSDQAEVELEYGLCIIYTIPLAKAKAQSVIEVKRLENDDYEAIQIKSNKKYYSDEKALREAEEFFLSHIKDQEFSKIKENYLGSTFEIKTL